MDTPSTPATESESASPQHRPIRSYVLREGRLTKAQERAFAELWPRWGIDWHDADGALDLAPLFNRMQPTVLEIGFGNGESLATMAAADPERNWLGVEMHRPGVGHLLLEIERLELNNLRVLRADAVALLAHGLAPAGLERIQLFFPDPWPKKRHHKRRILAPERIGLFARAIAPGGLLHLATDWQPYAEQMLETLEGATDLFENIAGQGCYSDRPAMRPLTKFEQRGQRLGHPVFDLIYRRC